MAYWTQKDLENALGPDTVIKIFDDTNTGTVNTDALDAVIARSDSEVDSYIVANYPDLVLPLTVNPTPNTLKFCSLEFGIVFARDRKPEYWSKAQEGERKMRLDAIRAKMMRILEAEQQLYDTAEPKPSTTGGIIIDNGPRTILDSADGTENGAGF